VTHFSERSFEAFDAARGRRFPITVWSPEGDNGPLVVYSHPSGQGRRAATFLCTFLASHGYVVAAMDHSECVVPEFKRPEGESEEAKLARWQAVIDSRVPDVRFLLDQLPPADAVGIVGHSFGGWTALAFAEADQRVRSVVALAPAGASNPKPGILPVKLDYTWTAPTLLIAAENDTALPLDGMYEIFEKTRAPKRMEILRGADHLHFVDACPDEEAHRFIREQTLAHFDATLK